MWLDLGAEDEPMRLRNHTDISSDWIRRVIRAVCPPGVAGYDVRVSNKTRGSFRGHAYWEGSGYRGSTRPLVIVSISRSDIRCRAPGGDGYLPMEIGSRLEALVVVMAHELRHLWQHRVPKGRRVWGSRGRYSERDADAYALKMLRRFRRGELLKPGAEG